MAPQTPEEVRNARHLRFRELVGSLLNISRSRPDIRYAVQKLTRFGNDWGNAQYKVALRVVGYLVKTLERSKKNVK